MRALPSLVVVTLLTLAVPAGHGAAVAAGAAARPGPARPAPGKAARADKPPAFLDRLRDLHPAPYRIVAHGFVTDASHPMHPGDFRADTLLLTLDIDPELGEARLEFGVAPGDTSAETWFVRRGRVFQVGERGEERGASALGDLTPATLAALHPALAGAAILERRESFVPAANSQDHWFAWNDEQWRVAVESNGRVTGLERRVHDDLHDDARENVHYEDWRPDGFGSAPRRVVVMSRGRPVAHFEFEPAVAIDSLNVPAGESRRDRGRPLRARDVQFREMAPHLFAADLTAFNTRVFVVEFANELAVIEGAYGSRACDVIAGVVRERFGKPVRWFAFSHLHGQYSGGVRSWIHEGATVLVPPTTMALVEDAARATHELEPDLLAREPRPLKAEIVAQKKSIADSLNALDVYNVPSGHTDEYFVCYFPRAKLLLSGDLFFYRPGKPVTGRSKQLCETVKRLGLEVDHVWCTWPLAGYGTQSVVNAEEWRKACASP